MVSIDPPGYIVSDRHTHTHTHRFRPVSKLSQLTARASRETSVRGMQAVACPGCILTRTEDTKVNQEITAVSAFHTVPSTTVPLICV